MGKGGRNPFRLKICKPYFFAASVTIGQSYSKAGQV